MTGSNGLPPPVVWAQRKSVVFLTICVEDCKDPVVKIENNQIYFKATGGAEKKDYENTIELYKEIDAEKSKYFVRDRVVDFFLVKKEEGPFWPALLKNKVKVHWLKVDFARWKDEDDTDDEDAQGGGGGGGGGGGKNQELEDMMRQMGGMGGGFGGGDMGGMGMPGMGGPPGERPSLDDLEDESDSDDDDLPDLE